jgi:hypothetical protein
VESKTSSRRREPVDGGTLSSVQPCLPRNESALITSLPFVHTARRSYRLGVLVKCSDWRQEAVRRTLPPRSSLNPPT